MRGIVGILRRALPLLTMAVLAAVAYDGWIFYSRWRAARQGEEASRMAEAQRDQQTLDMLGGTQFRIINFYAVPQQIRRGSQARICFGVYGAKSVRIEPQPGDVHPAISNCIEVTPRRDTAYKLTAEDAGGKTVTASLMIKVSP
jgi:hypothetical protein